MENGFVSAAVYNARTCKRGWKSGREEGFIDEFLPNTPAAPRPCRHRYPPRYSCAAAAEAKAQWNLSPSQMAAAAAAVRPIISGASGFTDKCISRN